MQTSTTFDPLTDACSQGPRPALDAELRSVHLSSPLVCHCCQGLESVSTDQYGETLCADCRDRASGDVWFDIGGG